eukprot:COSAG02_NODE_1302_length_13358_cov_12.308243_6_plen_82_part_00
MQAQDEIDAAEAERAAALMPKIVRDTPVLVIHLTAHSSILPLLAPLLTCVCDMLTVHRYRRYCRRTSSLQNQKAQSTGIRR